MVLPCCAVLGKKRRCTHCCCPYSSRPKQASKQERGDRGKEWCYRISPPFLLFLQSRNAEQSRAHSHIFFFPFLYSLLPWRVYFSLFHHDFLRMGWMDGCSYSDVSPPLFFIRFRNVYFYYYPLLFTFILFYLDGDDPINQSINQIHIFRSASLVPR